MSITTGVVRYYIVFLYLFLYFPVRAQMDIKKHFSARGVNGCFVLYNMQDGSYFKYNDSLCDRGYLPASTFKIPHTLIVLEEEYVADTAEVFPWNGREWPHKSWNQDQTLATAMKYSCIWVYIDFAATLGIPVYQKYAEAFNYGNKNLTGPADRFWLAGEFAISANQQVDFLRRFLSYDLPVSTENINTVKSLIVLDSGETYKLSGKTGGGSLPDEKYVMWLVGYVENNNGSYIFAMNFVTDDFTGTQGARMEITREILKELKIIP